MADVSNPEAIQFCNEQIRPLCELARGFKARVDAMAVDWFAGLNTTIGSAAGDDILDNREDEGVSRLTAADVTNAVAALTNAAAQMSDAVIAKPCVRPLVAE